MVAPRLWKRSARPWRIPSLAVGVALAWQALVVTVIFTGVGALFSSPATAFPDRRPFARSRPIPYRVAPGRRSVLSRYRTRSFGSARNRPLYRCAPYPIFADSASGLKLRPRRWRAIFGRPRLPSPGIGLPVLGRSLCGRVLPGSLMCFCLCRNRGWTRARISRGRFSPSFARPGIRSPIHLAPPLPGIRAPPSRT